MIRIDNLKLLKRKRTLNNVQLAEAYGCTDGHIGRLLMGKSSFGEKVARHIEEVFKLPRGWMDAVHLDGDYEDHADQVEQAKLRSAGAVITDQAAEEEEKPPTTSGVSEKPVSLRFPFERAKTYPMAPVIEWARIGEDLLRANSEWPTGELREVPTAREVSERIKWLPVLDDALAPSVTSGDLVAVDPEGHPKQDEVALFKTASGEYILRRWRAMPYDQFEAYDGQGRVLDSIRHGLTVVASTVGMFRNKF